MYVVAGPGRGARNAECIAKRQRPHTNLVYSEACPRHSPPSTDTDNRYINKTDKERPAEGVGSAPKVSIGGLGAGGTQGHASVKTLWTPEASNSRE